ncbi:MAG: helix-hairpin-helix domain-containing protein [Clostridiales bacterium]|jgi:hypothetical protein|nr:helix-hairpin-helix domain-containing protein [Clostridiales bacterium]
MEFTNNNKNKDESNAGRYIIKSGKVDPGVESMWVIWSFTFFLDFIGFLWVGSRTKNKSWSFLGFIYLAAIIAIIFSLFTAHLPGIAYFLYYLSGIVLSFAIRPNYIKRLQILKDLQVKINGLKREKIAGGENFTIQELESEINAVQNNLLPDIKISKKVNVNHCTEDELLMVPGFTKELADKATQIRNEKGYYSSFKDFILTLKIEPETAVKMQDRLSFGV